MLAMMAAIILIFQLKQSFWLSPGFNAAAWAIRSLTNQMTGMTSLQLKKGAAAAQKFASLTFLTAITAAVVISTKRLPVTMFGFSSFLPLGLFSISSCLNLEQRRL